MCHFGTLLERVVPVLRDLLARFFLGSPTRFEPRLAAESPRYFATRLDVESRHPIDSRQDDVRAEYERAEGHHVRISP